MVHIKQFLADVTVSFRVKKQFDFPDTSRHSHKLCKDIFCLHRWEYSMCQFNDILVQVNKTHIHMDTISGSIALLTIEAIWTLQMKLFCFHHSHSYSHSLSSSSLSLPLFCLFLLSTMSLCISCQRNNEHMKFCFVESLMKLKSILDSALFYTIISLVWWMYQFAISFKIE